MGNHPSRANPINPFRKDATRIDAGDLKRRLSGIEAAANMLGRGNSLGARARLSIRDETNGFQAMDS
jgi:hypothetical protein